jgi:hypothetical protein
MKHDRQISFALEYEYPDMPYPEQPKEMMPSDNPWVWEAEAIYEKNMFDAWLAVVRDAQERIANRMDSSKTTVIDGASAQEEFDQQPRQAQHQLDQLNKPNKPRKVVDVDDKGRLYVRDCIKDLDGLQ